MPPEEQKSAANRAIYLPATSFSVLTAVANLKKQKAERAYRELLLNSLKFRSGACGWPKLILWGIEAF